jgi:AraC family transcriptional regulator
MNVPTFARESGCNQSILSLPLPIASEDRWRVAPQVQSTAAAANHAGECITAENRIDGLIASRWTLLQPTDIEFFSTSAAVDYTVAIALKPASVHFRTDSTVFSGQLSRGATQVTVPGETAKAVFLTACDVVHLFIPQWVVERRYEEMFDRSLTGLIAKGRPPVRDAVLGRLASLLVETQYQNPATSLYTDAICTAIVARLIQNHFCQGALKTLPRASALPGWRLRRAIEYIDAHLAEPIRLVDIASSVGLSRMHFAAQFRQATGYSPHTFLTRRRIERAQHLLRHTSHMTVLDIALTCGFGSQSHFSDVFGRFVGETPRLWRAKERMI